MKLLLIPLMIFCFVSCEKYKLTPNLYYTSSQRIDQSFDVYRPTEDSERPRPAIIAIHGGAWMGGDKSWAEKIAAELCPMGFVVFAVNYRLSVSADGVWPAQIEDLQSFVRYVKYNAKNFNINPQKIASLGVSAGGHLAAMLALREDPQSFENLGRVNFALALNGEHDMTLPGDQCMADYDNIMAKVLGHGAPWSEPELRDISSIFYVRKEATFFLLHGEGDNNVYVKNSDLMYQALKRVGAHVEYVRLKGTKPDDEGFCHGNCWKRPTAKEAIQKFLKRFLLD